MYSQKELMGNSHKNFEITGFGKPRTDREVDNFFHFLSLVLKNVLNLFCYYMYLDKSAFNYVYLVYLAIVEISN